MVSKVEPNFLLDSVRGSARAGSLGCVDFVWRAGGSTAVDVEGYAQYYDIRGTGGQQSAEQVPSEETTGDFDRLRGRPADPARAHRIIDSRPIAEATAPQVREGSSGETTARETGGG